MSSKIHREFPRLNVNGLNRSLKNSVKKTAKSLCNVKIHGPCATFGIHRMHMANFMRNMKKT